MGREWGGESMSQPLLVRQQGPVAIFSINDAAMNRMSLEFMDQL